MKKYLYHIFFCVFAVMLFVAQNPVFAQATTTETSYINFLDSNSVSVTKTKYININGVDHRISEPQIISFENSDGGRASLAGNISDPFLSSILAVWDYSPVNACQTPSQPLLSEGTSAEETTSESETVTVDETMHIEFLNAKSVAFLKIQSTNIDGVDYQLGEPWAVSFENSTKGRESLAENIPDPFLSAVLAVWGDTPTVTLPVEFQSV